MTKKLKCNVTGNIIYMTEKRYAKLLAKYNGDEEALKRGYTSLRGRQVSEGIIEMPENITNRIRCSVTGRWCYITNERLAAGIAKYGSLENLNKNYICRPAKRLIKEGKTPDDIRKMIEDGVFPEK